MTIDRSQRAREQSMTQVTVTINGRQFRMSCEDGQETHLLRLAQELDGRIDMLRARFGEIGDTKLTVMAALTISDELSETAARLRRVEEEMTLMQDARLASAEHAQATQNAISAALNSAAERIERLTKSLNQTIGSGSIAMG
jgi:cell division protein ZapA